MEQQLADLRAQLAGIEKKVDEKWKVRLRECGDQVPQSIKELVEEVPVEEVVTNKMVQTWKNEAKQLREQAEADERKAKALEDKAKTSREKAEKLQAKIAQATAQLAKQEAAQASKLESTKVQQLRAAAVEAQEALAKELVEQGASASVEEDLRGAGGGLEHRSVPSGLTETERAEGDPVAKRARKEQTDKDNEKEDEEMLEAISAEIGDEQMEKIRNQLKTKLGEARERRTPRL